MIVNLIYLKLTYCFLFFIIFILEPEFFIVGLQLAVLMIQSFILGLTLSCALTIMEVYNYFKSKKLPELELYADVNNATIVTAYDSPMKCATVIIHPAFNNEGSLIVEEYDNEINAKTGHENWVRIFEKSLPNELRDITDNKIYKREYFE